RLPLTSPWSAGRAERDPLSLIPRAGDRSVTCLPTDPASSSLAPAIGITFPRMNWGALFRLPAVMSPWLLLTPSSSDWLLTTLLRISVVWPTVRYVVGQSKRAYACLN